MEKKYHFQFDTIFEVKLCSDRKWAALSAWRWQCHPVELLFFSMNREADEKMDGSESG